MRGCVGAWVVGNTAVEQDIVFHCARATGTNDACARASLFGMYGMPLELPVIPAIAIPVHRRAHVRVAVAAASHYMGYLCTDGRASRTSFAFVCMTTSRWSPPLTHTPMSSSRSSSELSEHEGMSVSVSVNVSARVRECACLRTRL